VAHEEEIKVAYPTIDFQEAKADVEDVDEASGRP
jgi:hypothetical protein